MILILTTFAFFVIIRIHDVVGIAEPFDGYFKPEMDCNKVGGLCLHEDLCDTKDRYDAGCPSQRSDGAVCCSKLPPNETRCEKYGGACFVKGKCGPTAVPKATDCGADQVCCVLTR